MQNTVKCFEDIIKMQLNRIENMKKDRDFVDYSAVNKLIIGICGGDGIGPIITCHAQKVLEIILNDDIISGKIELRTIEGLTIERRAKLKKAIPDDTLDEIKSCHVILKGPTTTPRKGDKWENVESANVCMRKELDLFANVRPVKVPEQNIDWIFYRENTEGSYAVGNLGLNVTDDLAVDFTVTTTQGCERIIKLAFEHAKKTGKNKVTAVTKANIIKTTDGKFLDICNRISKQYPEVSFDDWYIDIMAAKLIDEKRRSDFKVFVLPNLYGDILTDEAAQFQGGVGTAGSANIGTRYAMFEAIHGSAPRMVEDGREMYADPCSMFRASIMLLEHVGKMSEARIFEQALDKCLSSKEYIITGRDTGVTAQSFTEFLIETIKSL